MSIGAYLEQRGAAPESRVGSRRKLHLQTAAAAGSGDAMNVVVHDISETGLLLQTSAQLAVGEKIEIMLPEAGPTAATVVWASNEFFGCRFEEEISTATISAARLQSGPQPVAVSIEPAPATDSNPNESFGARLRRLRKERGISLIGLARLVSVSKPTVWKWEKDEVRPRQKSIHALASALNLSEGELLLGKKAAVSSAAEGSAVAASGHSHLRDLVQSCKEQIADAAGTSSDQVSITIQI